MSRPVGSKNTGESVRYSKTIFNQICERLAAGETLRRICRDEGYPSASAVIQWVMDDKDGCSKQYGKAREIQAQGYVDEIIEVAYDGGGDIKTLANGAEVCDKEFVARSRLKFDALRWTVSKVLPKIYGDKLDLTHAGEVTVNNTGIGLLLASAKKNVDEPESEPEPDTDSDVR